MSLEMKKKEKSINTILDASFARFGEKVAVEDHTRVLTYRELNANAESFARSLVALGLQPRSVVGIFMDGSIEYVIAVIGTLKAGMIFMPLNLAFPGGRLCSILEKTRPAVLIPAPNNEHDLRIKLQNFDSSIISKGIFVPPCIEGDKTKEVHHGKFEKPDAGFPDTRQQLHDDLNDACYIITTSGSTGEPKAILGSQKGLAHFIEWEINEFGFDENARVSLLSSVTFDVSLRDIFAPLAAGGTICIPGEDTIHAPAKLFNWMHGRKVTVIHIVPTLFRMLTRAIADEKNITDALSNLKYVFLAGEVLHGNDIKNWRQVAGKRSRIINLYGPSETTLAKLFHRVDDESIDCREIVPIGVPIPDTEVLIIKDGISCSPGEPGEIHIKTPFMSKGYYRDEELTRTHFIPSPLGSDQNDIVYKTGDQGVISKEGIVRFLGRLDGQIKLHGRRIELGEIEARLRQHKDVRQAAADLRTDASGNPRIIGYIVPEQGAILAVENLRRFLREKLPDYMLPQMFVNLEILPLTHNGKIDRKALPDAGPERPVMEIPYVPPANEQEKILCDIWQQVLGLDRVGTQDSFFDLGGTSIQVVMLVEKIRAFLQVDLPVAKVFQYPNVSLLSEYLQGKNQNRTDYAGLEKRAQRRRAAASSKKR